MPKNEFNRQVTGKTIDQPAVNVQNDFRSLQRGLDQQKNIQLQNMGFEAQQQGLEEASKVFQQQGSSARLTKENTIKSKTYDARIRNLILSQSKNDFANKARTLEAEFENDLEGFDKAFSIYKNNYINSIDPVVRPDTSLYANSLYANVSTKIKLNQDKIQKEQSLEQSNEALDNFGNTAINSAFDGNTQLLKYNQNNYNRMIDDQVEAGQISAVTAGRFKDRLKLTVYDQTQQGKFGRILETGDLEKASQFLQDFKNSKIPTRKFKNIDGDLVDTDEFSKLEKDVILGRMERNFNLSLNRKKAEEKTLNHQAIDGLKDAIDVFNNGNNPPQDIAQLGALAKGTKFEKPLTEAYQNFNNMQTFSLQLPSDQRDLIDKIEQKETQTKQSIFLLKKFKNIEAETSRLLEDDVLSLARNQGIIDDVSNMDTNQRAELMDTIKANYGVTPPLYTQNEQKVILEQFENGDIDKKINILSEISTAPVDMARTTLNKLFKNKSGVYRIVGDSVLNNDIDTAQNILSGQIIQKEKLIVDTEINNEIKNGGLQRIKEVIPSNLALTSDLRSAVGSYMAHAIYNKGLDAQDAQDEAIKNITGGIIEINDKKIFAPNKNITEDYFETWWDNLDKDDLESFGGLNGDYNIDEFRDNAKLEHRGQGEYAVRVGNIMLANKKGAELIIKFPQNTNIKDFSKFNLKDVSDFKGQK